MKLEVRGITKHFISGSENRTVLKDVSLRADYPHVLVLLGPSGGGKSTLLRIIAGLEKPDRGSIVLDGVEAPLYEDTHGKLLEYRRSLGVVFQSFNLFPHMTAFKNVALPLMIVHGLNSKEASERTLGVMDRLGLIEHRDKMPSQLSGGQRQRLAIARALTAKPRFLLFDEPTSALDPEMTAEVLSLIAELRETKTPMLLVTHEMGFARQIADQVAFLAEGRVVEHGSAASFFKGPESELAQRFLDKVLAY